MKKHTLSLAAGLLLPGTVFGQASPYRGLWVGEVRLDGVNEVSVPLDANNVPRAPNPAVTTKTFDAANLRLILHVNGAGQVSLLKQVAILNRKADTAQSENDVALVTDERLYGNFPPQPAQRLASVVFDFGDARATAAVDAVVNAAAAAAATSINGGGAQSAAQTAAQNAAAALINSSDAAERFAVFLRDVMNSGAVTALAGGAAVTAAQTTDAADLRDGTSVGTRFEVSFYKDSRGVDMIAAIQAAIAAESTAEAKKKAAHNAASNFADVENAYQRFVAGEVFGDMIVAAAQAAGTAAAGVPRLNVEGFGGTTAYAAPVEVTTVNHNLVTGDRISIIGAPVAAYNGVHTVTRVDAAKFSLPGVPYIAGKAVTGYAATAGLTPVTVVSAGHGLATGARVVISGAGTGTYDGGYYITRISDDAFSIPAAFVDDPAAKGQWSSRGGVITGYESAPGGVSGVKVTAPGHGLNNGDTIVITGAGAAVYNGSRVITRIDANSFTIPVAFGGNPAAKGAWSVQNDISAWQEPAVKTTTVTSSAHGLTTGDRIVISSAGKAAYNAVHEVEVLSANTFSIPVTFDAADGNPGSKGTWAPELAGSWKKLTAIRTAVDANAKVNDARTRALQVKVAAYDDTRATDAIATVLDAIVAAAADAEETSPAAIATLADSGGREAQASAVARAALAAQIPTPDYTAFIRADDPRFTDFRELAPVVASAAALGAFNEYQNVLHTATTVQNKAKEAILAAIPSVYATAARALQPQLRLAGDFGPGETGLTGTISLPANHPTNPFRHRRHPDHSTGLDITRILTLNFDGAAGDSLSATGFGVDNISGTYAEEIHGLHKPLGPQKDIGLRVSGTFKLHRISRIDTLNGR
jgi:hypothetical protein